MQVRAARFTSDGAAPPYTGDHLVCGDNLRCAACGSDDLIAIKAGAETVFEVGGKVLMKRGTGPTAWCCSHWPWRARDVG
jgi:hypothetical protein